MSRVLRRAGESGRSTAVGVKMGREPSGGNRGLSRHFEGWQLGALAVTIAVLGALLALPRGAPPTDLPLPTIDRAELGRAAGRRAALSRRAVESPLAYEVRAVGDAVRRFGIASYNGNGAEVEQVIFELRRAVGAARTEHGLESLEVLRALQAQLFLDAVRRWQASGVATRDLTELGGTFVERAIASGWMDERRHLVLEADELATSFSIRWSQLCGLASEPPLMPTLNEWRVYFHARLRHPEVGPQGGAEARIEVLRQYVAALSKRDPDYPGAFADGVLDFRLHRYGAAAAAFRAHINSVPAGRWSLRAQNHLVAALDRAAGG